MFSRSFLMACAEIAGLAIWGCSGSSPNPAGTGGASSAVGGAGSGGLASSNPASTAGGNGPTGGTKNTGGISNVAGSPSSGGANGSTGGSLTATGGLNGSGGAATGGVRTTGGTGTAGGAKATGGTKSVGGGGATGGITSSIGGSLGTGGGGQGGNNATGGTQGCSGSVCNTVPTGLLDPNITTQWNPGILIDNQLHLPLGNDGLPVRTTVCASPSPGANLNTAINNCPEGQVVQLAAGKYTISSTVTLTKGVVLRGAGSQGSASGGTTIVMTGGGSVLSIGTDQDQACYSSSFGTAYALTQNAVKETNVVYVGSNASHFSAGDIALIDQADDATVQEGDCTFFKRVDKRSVSERVEVSAVSTANGTLTLTTPLHWTFQSASPYSAQIARVTQPIIKWAGIEGLLLQGGTNPGYNGQMAGGIDISNAAYCWVKDVQTDGTIGGMHVSMTGTYRCVVRDSNFHNSANYGFGADCYGIVVGCGSSDNLVENNIARYMNKPIMFNVSGGGNVIGYNYADNSWATPATFMEDNIDSHCSFPHMELMEGNYAPHMAAAATHGNAGYLTFFRNYSSSQFASPPVVGSTAKQTGNINAIGFGTGDINMTIVGNVLGSSAATDLGTATVSNTYICAAGNDSPCIYLFSDNGGTTDVSYTSAWIHGNYDTVNKAVVWNPSITAHQLPASLYLAAKPAWWPAANAWPWAGSDLTPMIGTLPAKARSDSLGQ